MHRTEGTFGGTNLAIYRYTRVFAIEDPNMQAPQLKGTVRALYEYMEFHFGNEELLMRNVGFPEYEDHLSLHKAIIAKMNDIMTSCRSLEELHTNLQPLMVDWVLTHMQRNDQKIGRFIHNSTVLPAIVQKPQATSVQK